MVYLPFFIIIGFFLPDKPEPCKLDRKIKSKCIVSVACQLQERDLMYSSLTGNDV